MNESELTQIQHKKIEDLKKEIGKELDEIEKNWKLSPNTFSNASNKPYLDLWEKYRKKLQAIYESKSDEE